MSSRGITSNADASHPPSTRAPTATALRRGFHDRLDEGVTKALDAFQNITTSCVIRDRASNARADYQAEVEAANLARAADELLRVISELKIAAIVQDVTEGKKEATELRALFDTDMKQSVHEIGRLRETVANSLSALEEHYYASCARWGVADES